MMEEWKECRLGDICDIYDGPHATPPKQKSGFVFLGISSLDYDGRIDPVHFEFVSKESFKKWTKRVEPQFEDIVFSYETKLGVAAMIPDGFKCCLGRRMGLLRPKKGVMPKFLLYSYLGPSFQKIIYERTYHGSTVDRIPLKEMPDFPIGLPPLPEQKAIASVLSSLDDKIGLLHRQNKTLEAMAETVFRQWFVEEVQEDWEHVKLENLIKISSGKGLKRGGGSKDGAYPVLGANGEIGRANDFLFEEKLLFTGRVGTLGNIFRIENERVWLSDNTLVIRPIDYFNFVYFLLKAAKLDEYNVGSTQPLIRQTDIKEIEINLPSENKLNSFETKTDLLFRKKLQNKSQIRTLEKLRDTLLPKLMNGEVRVEYDAS